MNTVPAEPVLPEAVADLVARLRRAMRKAARVRAPAMPLSVARLELLSLLQEHPGARLGDLAGLLHLAANSVSTLANAMVSAGMLDRLTPTQRQILALLDIPLPWIEQTD